MRLLAAFLALAAALLPPFARAQQGCTISGKTMICPNGVMAHGVGESLMIGGKSMGEGSFDRKTPDGRDVHDFGNQGVVIGGEGQAERLTPAAPPLQPPPR